MATAAQTLSMLCARKMGVMHSAHSSMVALRAKFTERPDLIRRDDIQPPATLPRSEIR